MSETTITSTSNAYATSFYGGDAVDAADAGGRTETQQTAQNEVRSYAAEACAPFNPPSAGEGVNMNRVLEQCSSSFQDGSVGGSGSASAATWAESHAFTSTTVGAMGVRTEARAGVSAGARAEAHGQINTSFGSASGNIVGEVVAFAEVTAYAQANTTNAEAGATAQLGAMARSNANVDVDVLGIARGHATGEAEAGTGARAAARASIGYDPPTVLLTGKGGAFAGARASFQANAGVAGLGYGLFAEAWAGVGAKAQVNVGLDGGTLKFGFGLGIALGVGTFLRVDFELNMKPLCHFAGDVVQLAANIFNAVADLFGGGKGDHTFLLSVIQQALGELATGLKKNDAAQQADWNKAARGDDVAPTESSAPTDAPDHSTPTQAVA